MRYTVAFRIQNQPGFGGRWPEYRWWSEFVEQFFIVGEAFEIRCWEKDIEGIEAAKRFGTEVENELTNERVFQGLVTEAMLDELHTDYLAKNGILKWFSIFVHCPSGEEFQCEHYGNELYLTDCDKRTAEDVKRWAMKFECFRNGIYILS